MRVGINLSDSQLRLLKRWVSRVSRTLCKARRLLEDVDGGSDDVNEQMIHCADELRSLAGPLDALHQSFRNWLALNDAADEEATKYTLRVLSEFTDFFGQKTLRVNGTHVDLESHRLHDSLDEEIKRAAESDNRIIVEISW